MSSDKINTTSTPDNSNTDPIMTPKPRSSEARKNAVGIRFLRNVPFPRFRMKAGELWDAGFDPVHGLGETAREYYAAIDSGADRFPFAGGYCFVTDVKLVFLSPEQVKRCDEIRAIVADVMAKERRKKP